MQEENRFSKKIFADENDLSAALVSACSLLQVSSQNASAEFHKYTTLRAAATLEGGKIHLKASDGFRSASGEVLLGLCLYLASRLFMKRVRSEHEKYVGDYAEFTASEGSHKLSNSMRVLRGRRREARPKGEFHNLNESIARVAAEYWNVLGNVSLPTPTWGDRQSTRVLGFYDDAFNEIVINKALDDRRVPDFVLDYVVYHELLHAKHSPHYARGKSLRTTVHTAAFKRDEGKYPRLAEARAWVSRNRRLFYEIRNF